MYGGGVSKGSPPSTVSLEAVTIVLTPARMAARRTLYVAVMLLWNVATSGSSPRSGHRRQVHDRIEAGGVLVDAHQRIDGLSVVRQIDLHEPGSPFAGPVEIEHVVPLLPEHAHHRPAELARPAGHRDPHQAHLPPPMFRCR